MKETYFGARDKLWDFDPMLIKCTRFVPQGRVLDLGLGRNGRNALFFSMLGYDVDGVDIDESALQNSLERARALGVRLNARTGDISNIEIEPESYSIITAMYMWQYFSREEALRVITKMKSGVCVGGVVHIALFAPEDICFDRVKRDPNFKLVAPNTYLAEKGGWWGCKTSSKQTYVHAFTKEDLMSLFSDFEMLHCSESADMDIDHGKPHHHQVIIYVGRKIP